jgi:GNAT superfamily N-acetyltransferase
MSARIEAARKLGVHWEAETTPFAWVEEERALAHVGVIAHPLRLLGEDRMVAGIQAVCVDPEARGRGLGRRCMEAALAWIDGRFDLAKLSTTIPAFYERWGFFVMPTHRFRRSARRRWRSGAPRGVGRHSAHPRAALGAYADLRRLCHPGVGLAADHRPCTQGRLPGGVLVVPRRDFLIVARHQGEVLHLDDVAGPELPGLEEVLAAIPFRFERVIYGFTPDRLDPGARPEPVPVEEGVMQVRGPWPELPPFAVSSVWEH